MLTSPLRRASRSTAGDKVCRTRTPRENGPLPPAAAISRPEFLRFFGFPIVLTDEYAFMEED